MQLQKDSQEGPCREGGTTDRRREEIMQMSGKVQVHRPLAEINLPYSGDSVKPCCWNSV